MTDARRTEVQQLALLIGGLITISALMTISALAVTSAAAAVVTGLVLLGVAVAGRRWRVPTVLAVSTAAFGVVLLVFGVTWIVA